MTNLEAPGPAKPETRATDAATVVGASDEKSASGDVEKAPQPPAPVLDFPDGGLEAWLVVVGGWLVLFATFGYVNGWFPPSFMFTSLFHIFISFLQLLVYTRLTMLAH
jgi:hypothetical protein